MKYLHTMLRVGNLETSVQFYCEVLGFLEQSREEYPKALAILEEQSRALKAGKVEGNTKIAKISLVGVGLRSHPAIIGTLYKCFGSQNIGVQLVQMKCIVLMIYVVFYMSIIMNV